MVIIYFPGKVQFWFQRTKIVGDCQEKLNLVAVLVESVLQQEALYDLVVDDGVGHKQKYQKNDRCIGNISLVENFSGIWCDLILEDTRVAHPVEVVGDVREARGHDNAEGDCKYP